MVRSKVDAPEYTLALGHQSVTQGTPVGFRIHEQVGALGLKVGARGTAALGPQLRCTSGVELLSCREQ